MYYIGKARAKCSSVFIPAVCVSAAAAFLAGQVQDVRAGVFEQTCNGKVIAIGSGTLLGVPLHQQTQSSENGQRAVLSSVIEFGLPSATDTSDVSAGATLAADAAPPSICADPPVETTSLNSAALRAMRLTESKLSLPAPLKLSQTFSSHQVEMRELTAEVGLRFAGAPGVRKAKLDTPTFTKLFTTLVHRESNFKPRAVSPAGARGLGQLMPLTARDLGVKDSFSPDENLVGAATYLTEMLDRFESPELALAAYNAGPAAVEKYRGIPPYRETRQYVADIFHEVLREPYPTYVTARMKQHALRLDPDIQLASLTAESRTAPANKDPFATLLTGTPQVTQDGARLELTAFTSTTEASTAPSAPSKVAQRSEVLPTPDPEPRPEMGRTSASETGGAAIRATPLPPDLTTLPEPREFTGELSKAQLAIRDLATDIALLHSKAPGVENSGLSEEAFATLFVALIRRESSFNSRAVSRDGAKGLGQLKPATIREMGVKNPFSAKENLEGSVKYFTGLLDEFSSPVLALAGYNAGRTAVREKGGIPDDRKTRQFIADVLHDIKSDPRPEFVVVRLNKWSAALVVSSEEAAKLNTVSELARQGLVKSEPKQSSRPHSAEQQIERPVFAAAINPVALSGGPTNGMTRGRFIASLSVAFVITGLCIAVAGTSAGDQSKTSGWKRLLRWSRCRSRSNKIDGACELGGAVPVVVQASSKEQACMSPAIASQIPKKTLHSRFV